MDPVLYEVRSGIRAVNKIHQLVGHLLCASVRRVCKVTPELIIAEVTKADIISPGTYALLLLAAPN
jgi:hypothetical protein